MKRRKPKEFCFWAWLVHIRQRAKGPNLRKLFRSYQARCLCPMCRHSSRLSHWGPCRCWRKTSVRPPPPLTRRSLRARIMDQIGHYRPSTQKPNAHTATASVPGESVQLFWCFLPASHRSKKSEDSRNCVFFCYYVYTLFCLLRGGGIACVHLVVVVYRINFSFSYVSCND